MQYGVRSLGVFFILSIVCNSFVVVDTTKQTFSYTGAAQSIRFPSDGSNALRVWIWGGGGGGGYNFYGGGFPYSRAGGAGGFIQGVYVGLRGGDLITVEVGRGGWTKESSDSVSTVVWPDGGGYRTSIDCTGTEYWGGSGGGSSRVYLGANGPENYIAVAGGGGGGGTKLLASGFDGSGGGGGVSGNGGYGTEGGAWGGGGTRFGGRTLTNHPNECDSGAGGGGVRGGLTGNILKNSKGGGGGGSSGARNGFVSEGDENGAYGSSTGIGGFPGGTTLPEYVSGIGNGGSGAKGSGIPTDGGHGYIVIEPILTTMGVPAHFAYTGNTATFTKASNHIGVRFWVWGGGGGGGFNWYGGGRNYAKAGGGGGYMSGLIGGFAAGSTVSLTVEVGQGGFRRKAATAWPDGGPAGVSTYRADGDGGGGGGSSRVYLTVPGDAERPLVVAGGGGGGGSLVMNEALPGISGAACGLAGGGCLQWTDGKGNDELIDVSCDNRKSGGVGGQEIGRNGGACVGDTVCHRAGSGGGGYRGGDSGRIASSWWESGGGGLSYYDEASVFLEGDECGDRLGRAGGYDVVEYPGGVVGYGGHSGLGTESVAFSMASDGGDGYVILQGVVECPGTVQTYDAVRKRCVCPSGTYVYGGYCLACTLTCEGIYIMSSACDGLRDIVCVLPPETGEFLYTGNVSTFRKAAGYIGVRFWVWGGGGGGGYNTMREGYEGYQKGGGGGGYMSGLIFGLGSGEVDLKIEVGQGGFRLGSPAAWPDGGSINPKSPYGTYWGGGGGGSSRVYTVSADTPLVVAGGGGGGGGQVLDDVWTNFRGDLCGDAGGGCLQWTDGKGNDELIDVSCDTVDVLSGVGGQEADRHGGSCYVDAVDDCKGCGSGGGGYRGGARGIVRSVKTGYGSGAGGRSYYDDTHVILEEDKCGDRSGRAGGYDVSQLPGVEYGRGGLGGRSGLVAERFDMASDGYDGYVIVQSVNECPGGVQSYNSVRMRCECGAGGYISGFLCLGCTICGGDQWAFPVCDGVTNAVCNDCSAVCSAGQVEITACTSTTNRVCSGCIEGYYALSGGVGCGVCPVGAFCGGGSALPVCESGYFPSGVGYECSVCPVGAFCGGGAAMPVCESGYFPSGVGYGCNLCPIGSYCVGGGSGAVVCPPGDGSQSTLSGGANSSSACMCSSGWEFQRAEISYEGSVCMGGNAFRCVVFSDGRVKCWGANWADIFPKVSIGAWTSFMGDWGSVGYMPFPAEDKVFQLSCCETNVCALLRSGHVKCFGLNTFGQVGFLPFGVVGDRVTIDQVPSHVPLGTNTFATSVSVSGHGFGCAVVVVGGVGDGVWGDVKCWGNNVGGVLGVGHTNSPVVGSGSGDDLVATNLGTDVTCRRVVCGGSSCCALCRVGTGVGSGQGVKCWGSDDAWLPYGELFGRGGDAGGMGDNLPWVDFTAGGVDVLYPVELSLGLVFCALLSDSSVKCWGVYRAMSILGLLPVWDTGTPRTLTQWNALDFVSGVTKNVARLDGKCVVLTNGELRCFGVNTYGGNGVGNTAEFGQFSWSHLYEVGAVVGYGVNNMPPWTTGTSDVTCAVTSLKGLSCWGANGGGGYISGDASVGFYTTPFDIDLGLLTGADPASLGSVKGVDGCQVCGPGTYKSGVGNSSSCGVCPLNSQSGFGSVSIFGCVCNAGFEAVNVGIDFFECGACGVDTYKESAGVGACVACGLDSSTFGGIGGSGAGDCYCVNGTRGAVGSGGSFPCVVCGVDTYSAGSGQTECVGCPSGSGTNGATKQGGVESCVCVPGYEGAGGGVSGCVACGANSYKSLYGDGSCVGCGANSVTVGGGGLFVSESSCECDVGYYDESGGVGGGVLCKMCDVGTYKDHVGNGACSVCPLHTITGGNGSVSVGDCLCVGDWYGVGGVGGVVGCSACPLHSHASGIGNMNLSACICEAGYRECNSSAEECVLCGRGEYCPGDEKSHLCGGGVLSGVRRTTFGHGSISVMDCVCEAGFFGDAGGGACEVCPVDSYCPLNSSVGVVCRGNSSTRNASGSVRWSDCTCDEGHYSLPGVGGECLLCAVDHYCPGGNVSVLCGEHTSTRGVRGAASVEECVADAGYYLLLRGVNNNNATSTGGGDDGLDHSVGVLCPKHHYCEGGVEPGRACPPFSKGGTGMWAVSQCVCVGFYQGVCHDSCSDMCSECDANSYCPEGNVMYGCVSGTESGAGSASDGSECSCVSGTFGGGGGPCAVCGVDSFCPGFEWGSGVGRGIYSAGVVNGSIDLREVNISEMIVAGRTFEWGCPGNTSTHGVGGKKSLLDCSAIAGFYGPDVPFDVVACPIGHWCAGGLSGAVACPAHSSTVSVGSVSIKDCLCDGGYYDGDDDDVCEGCEAGFFCPDLDDGEHACAGNTTSLSGVAFSAGGCFCIGGFFGGGGGPCEACPSGAYCPGGSVVVGCRVNAWSVVGSSAGTDCLCVGGYYGVASGPCTLCPVNSWCSGGASVPVAACPGHSLSAAGSSSVSGCVCESGYYGSVFGGGSFELAECSLCPANHFCGLNESVGQPVAVACPVNAVSYVGSTALSDCFCPAGYTGGDGSVCVVCPEGEVCGGGNSSVRCPPFSSVGGGASSLEDCVCDVGYYGLNGGVCRVCDVGKFCPGLGNMSVEDCPGHTTSLGGSGDVLECFCVGGYYEVSRGSGCVACGVGSYCEGDLHISGCPANQTTSGVGSSSIYECSCVESFYGPNGGVCSPCPEGHYCPGGLNILTCPEHSLAVAGASGPESCVCVSGFYGGSSSSGGGGCKRCEFGMFCGGGSISSACPSFSNTSHLESSLFEECICERGRFMNLTSLECDVCPGGFFCVGDNLRRACPFSSNIVGAMSLSGCTCPDGEYRVDDGGECLACAVGHYCSGGEISACPAGSGTLGVVGNEKFSDCVCERGFLRVFSPSALRLCVRCPSGYWCDGSSTPRACSYLLGCQSGSEFRSGCNSTHDHVCERCSNIPANGVGVAGSTDCRWVCSGGYFLRGTFWGGGGVGGVVGGGVGGLNFSGFENFENFGNFLNFLNFWNMSDFLNTSDFGNMSGDFSLFDGTMMMNGSESGGFTEKKNWSLGSSFFGLGGGILNFAGLPNETGFLGGECVACDGNASCLYGEYRPECPPGGAIGESPHCVGCTIPLNGRLPKELYESGVLHKGECDFVCLVGFFKVVSAGGVGHCCDQNGFFSDELWNFGCQCLPGWVKDHDSGRCLM